jgi:catechol 2,3-dioxygenase-like lactoylglutathione lyase family enzyme
MVRITDVFVTIASLDLNRSVGFYQGFFESAPVVCHVDRYAEFHLPGLRLAIFCPNLAHRSEFESPARSAMSLCVEVADLDGAIARLVAIGYPPPGDMLTASHGREIYAYDPDGNRLILHEAKPITSMSTTPETAR